MMKNKILLPKTGFKSALASRQLIYILLFSSLITLISASFQIYIEYRADVDQIYLQMKRIEQSHLASLTNSLWHLDDEQIQIQLQETLAMESIVFLQISEKQTPIFSAGVYTPSEPHVSREFPLVFKSSALTQQIGNFRVVASLEGVYQRLYQRILIVLTTQAVKTFLVSLFILFIIYHLVTRHLVDLAAQTTSIDLKSGENRFSLDRRKRSEGPPDELDQLVAAFNQMHQRLLEDIIEQQQAEKKIKKRDKMIRAVFEAAQQVALIMTSYGPEEDPVILEFSSGAENIFGYSRAEMMGSSATKLFPPEEGMACLSPEKPASPGQTLFSGEITMIKKSGKRFFAIFSSYPIIDDRGQTYAVLGVALDISEQKQLELKYRHAQKMESIGTMAGGIAHHFNNILGVMMGNAELAIQDMDKRRPAFKNISEIITASLRAKSMIRQLLSFSSQSRMEKGPVDMVQTVKDCVRRLKPLLPASVKVYLKIGEIDNKVFAHPMLVDQILTNLTENAAEAMPGGGDLKIELVQDDYDPVSVGIDPAYAPGRYVVLSVTDTGFGISKEETERIFEPYFTTKGMGESSGMGLAVVHGIVNDLGGHIRVESEPGSGSRFELFFPAIDDESV